MSNTQHSSSTPGLEAYQDVASNRIESIFKSFLSSLSAGEQEEIMKVHAQSMSFLGEIESSLDSIMSLIPENQVKDLETESEEDDNNDNEEESDQ